MIWRAAIHSTLVVRHTLLVGCIELWLKDRHCNVFAAWCILSVQRELLNCRSALLGERRTSVKAWINALRAHLAEFGVIAPQGLRNVSKLIAVVRDESDTRLPAVARQVLEAAAVIELKGRRSIPRVVLVAAVDDSLAVVLGRWREICFQWMRTTIVSQSSGYLAPVLPIILCAPKFLDGSMTPASVFTIVQSAFNWLVDNYPRLADWTASARSVSSLMVSLDALARAETGDEVGRIERAETDRAAMRLAESRTRRSRESAPLRPWTTRLLASGSAARGWDGRRSRRRSRSASARP